VTGHRSSSGHETLMFRAVMGFFVLEASTVEDATNGLIDKARVLGCPLWHYGSISDLSVILT
jgi:hypothetical protein